MKKNIGRQIKYISLFPLYSVKHILTENADFKKIEQIKNYFICNIL